MHVESQGAERTIEGGSLHARAKRAERKWRTDNREAGRVLDVDSVRRYRAAGRDVLIMSEVGGSLFWRICYEAHGDDLMPVDVWWADEVA